MQRTQRGMTLLGFLLVLIVVGFFAYVAMRLVPMYTEYYAVKQSLKGLQQEPGIANKDPGAIEDLFFRRLYINYSENVKPDNVKLVRDGSNWKMNVNYEVRRPMIGNIDVVGKFDTTQELTNTGDNAGP